MNSHAIFIFVLGVNFATATCSFPFHHKPAVKKFKVAEHSFHMRSC